MLYLPALANIFETSVDLLIGMDTIRAEETRFNIHKEAVEYQRSAIMMQLKNISRCIAHIPK